MSSSENVTYDLDDSERSAGRARCILGISPLAWIISVSFGVGVLEGALILIRAQPLGWIAPLCALSAWVCISVFLCGPWLIARGLLPPSALSAQVAYLICLLIAAGSSIPYGSWVLSEFSPNLQPLLIGGGTLGLFFLLNAGAPGVGLLIRKVTLRARDTFTEASFSSRLLDESYSMQRRMALQVSASICLLSLTYTLYIQPEFPARLTPILGGALSLSLLCLASLSLTLTYLLNRLCRYLIIIAPLALLVTMSSMATAPHSEVLSASTEGILFGRLMAISNAWSDDDSDGFGDHFGGRDCDDNNPKIHPSAREVVGNNIDENCVGGPAQKRFSVKRALPKGTPPKGMPHIILIVVDSLRADHVSLLGGDLAQTQHIDDYFREGARFSRAFSSSTTTRMAMPALLSSRWISHSRYEERPSHYKLDSRVDLLPEALRRTGYRTIAILPSFLRSRIIGLKRGFNRVIGLGSSRDLRASRGWRGKVAVQTTLREVSELQETPQADPHFIYLHLDDPHAPLSKVGVPKGVRGQRALYARIVERVDRDLSELFKALEILSETRPVLVALTADHGEAFGEHNNKYHGHDLYGETLSVPLLMRGVGIKSRTLDTPVDLLDLGASLALAGGAQIRRAQGESLWGLLEGKLPRRQRPLFAELRVLYTPFPTFASVIEWPLKLIRRWDTGQVELFDLKSDPTEQVDLSRRASHLSQNERLLKTLFRWADGGTGPAGRLSVHRD